MGQILTSGTRTAKFSNEINPEFISPKHDKIIDFYCRRLGIPRPPIFFNPKLVSTLGLAFTSGKIEISVHHWIYGTEIGKLETLAHELCHIKQLISDGHMDHKKTWRRYMDKLGFVNARKCGAF